MLEFVWYRKKVRPNIKKIQKIQLLKEGKILVMVEMEETIKMVLVIMEIDLDLETSEAMKLIILK